MERRSQFFPRAAWNIAGVLLSYRLYLYIQNSISIDPCCDTSCCPKSLLGGGCDVDWVDGPGNGIDMPAVLADRVL